MIIHLNKFSIKIFASLATVRSLENCKDVKPVVFRSNGLVVKALDSQSKGPVFKTTGWFQGRLSRSSFRGR